MIKNKMKHILSRILILGFAVILCGTTSGVNLDAKEMNSGSGLVFELTENTGEPGIATGAGASEKGDFVIKVDLVKITPSKVIQLKSNFLPGKNNVPVEYTFGLRPAADSEIYLYRLKITPTVINESPLETEFLVELYVGTELIQETEVTIKERESVMVEFMENEAESSKLAVRLAPVLDTGKLKQQFDKTEYKKKSGVYDDATAHKVRVDIKLLPVYAVTEKGDPVYDLAKEDLELYVNGTKYDIAHLKPYDFGKSRDERKDLEGKKQQVLQKEPDRIVFIIIDQVFNNFVSIKRAKDIANRLVDSGSEGDFFHVMYYSPFKGLQHAVGPTNDKKTLKTAISQITQLPPSRLKDILESNANLVDTSLDLPGRLENQQEMRILDKSLGPLHYQIDVQSFERVLSDFKYALKTVDKPKMVFLISKGVARDSFNNVFGAYSFTYNVTFDAYLFSYFGRIAKAVNEGGSLLYTINSEKIIDSLKIGLAGEVSLREMARRSGGKYFYQSDPDLLTKDIKRTLAAYYELAFTPETKGDLALEIKLKSKRKGVKVNTVKYTEIERPYHEMPDIQKKLFALNIVKKGNWSYSLAKIRRVSSKTVKRDRTGNKVVFTQQVMLPKGLRNSRLDTFVIRVNDRTKDSGVDIYTEEVKDRVEIKVPGTGEKDEKLYFVIIEPKNIICIYNEVK